MRGNLKPQIAVHFNDMIEIQYLNIMQVQNLITNIKLWGEYHWVQVCQNFKDKSQF